jgi:hypothetical protein
MRFPIPEILKDTLTRDYLRECILCNTDVLKTGVPYAIEKAFKRFPELDVEQTVFEYCICQNCHLQSRKELSVKSLENIESFFLAHQQIILEHSLKSAIAESAEELFEVGLISGQAKNDLNGYQLFAHCQGEEVLVDRGAFMLTDATIEQLSSLISQKTRDHLNDFMDNNFGLPPELKKKLTDNPVLAF